MMAVTRLLLVSLIISCRGTSGVLDTENASCVHISPHHPVIQEASPFGQIEDTGCAENKTLYAEECIHGNTTRNNGSTVHQAAPTGLAAARSALQMYYSMPMTVLGILGCVVTIIVLQRGALQTTSASIYIRGIVAANIIIGSIAFVYHLGTYHSVAQTRAWGVFYLYFRAYLYQLNFIGVSCNAWTILAFATERFLALQFPLKFQSKYGKSRAKKAVLLIFFAGVVTNIIRMFEVTVKVSVDPETNKTSYVNRFTDLGANRVYQQIAFLFYGITAIFSPVILTALLTILVIRKLRMVGKVRKSLEENRPMPQSHTQAQVGRILLANLCSFFLCHVAAAAIVLTVALFGRNLYISDNPVAQLLFLVNEVLYTAHPFLNFVLYVCCSAKLRTEVKMLFCFDWPVCENNVRLEHGLSNLTTNTNIVH